LTLAVGLIFHKLLWEVLRRKASARQNQKKHSPTLLSTSVKALKAVVFVFLIVQTVFLDLFPISESPARLQIAGMVIFVVGLALAIVGRLQLGKNWLDLEDAQVLSGQWLVTGGVYAYIRHPIYSGDILLLIGLELALNSWLVLAVSLPLLIVVKRAAAEEALLARAYPNYDRYCQQTKRFIPFIA
jgi:protein-S-isoprenylcysteine O-methyltransferase Ste14